MERPIEYWRDLYLLHSESKTYKKRLSESIDFVNRFLDLGVKSYVGWSCGKDSTVLAHLVNYLYPNYPIVSEKDDLDFPDEIEYLQSVSNKFGFNSCVISPDVKLWDILVNHDFNEDIHSKGTSFSDDYFYGLLRKHQSEHEYKGVFLGLRASESKGRLINAKVNRYIYYNQEWRQIVCQPLMNWSAQDVFAYLFANDVPILSVYFKTAFHDSPEQIRKSWILPSHQASLGQAQWIKHYYPEIFLRLSMIDPKIRAYV